MNKDYFMRMIEQAVAFLLGVALKAERGKMQEAAQDLDQMCGQTVGLDVNAVLNASPDEVAHLLEQGGALRYARSIILAEILLTDATLKERANAGLPLKNLVHAFCLISDSIDMLGIDDEKIYRVKLRELAARLESCRGIPALKERFARLAEG